MAHDPSAQSSECSCCRSSCWIAVLSQGAKTNGNPEQCDDACQSTAQCRADAGGHPLLLVWPGIPDFEPADCQLRIAERSAARGVRNRNAVRPFFGALWSG